MTRAAVTALLVALLLALGATGAGGAGPAAVDPGRWSVGADSPAAASALAQRLRGMGYGVRVIPRIGDLEVDAAGSADRPARALSGDGRVEWIEPVQVRTLSVDPPEQVDPVTHRPFEWAFDAVGAAGALAAVGGGSRYPVGIVDSGVDVQHPGLAGRIAATKDLAGDGSSVTDFVGHGTFVAGLISAIGGTGIGMRGVAGATPLLAARVTTTGSITSTAAAAGIVWAVDSGAKVVNLSFGGPGLASAESDALDYARAHDVLVVASAGNGAQQGNGVEYPAAALGGVRGGWGSGLSVGASDPSGQPAPFSTFNDFVSLSAPGAGAGPCDDGVVSTIPGNATSFWDSGGCARSIGAIGAPGGRYGYAQGTSFSAPLVAGAAALVREANPALRADQTADVLRRSAHQTVGSGWNPHTGAGVLDMTAAVALARQYDTVAPEPLVTVTPGAGTLDVQLDGRDAGPPGGQVSGIASLSLEGSADGASYAPLGSAATGPVRTSVAVERGGRRWFRATACDVDHNCATVVRGPFSLAAGSAGSPPAAHHAAAARLAVLRAVQPSRCPHGSRACARVVFQVGVAPAWWQVVVRQRRPGIRLAARTGRVDASGRVFALLTWRRPPACGGRLEISIGLRTASGSARAVRRLAVRGPCVVAPPRRERMRAR